MTESNSILIKLDGLESRYEEVSTLITDPSVIADQERYVKLTREYKELGDIMEAKKKYICCLNSIKEAKDILTNESDPEMKETPRTCRWKSGQEQVETRLHSLQETYSKCIRNSATAKTGISPSPV